MKLWGGLGLPLLLLVPRRRDLATATIAFTTVVVGAFAPFILFGEFTSFDYVWVVKPHSPLAFFIEPLTAVGWPARVIQGAAAVGVGSMLAVRSRMSMRAVWSVPLGIVAARMLLDPLDYHYYWLSVGMIVLAGSVALLDDRPSLNRIVLAGFYFATLWPFFYLSALVLGGWIVIACLSLLVWSWHLGTNGPLVQRVNDRSSEAPHPSRGR
jgi:hypothetical protein